MTGKRRPVVAHDGLPPTVDVHQAAELMKVHHKTVEDLIASGVLPAGKVGRALVLLTRDVLDHIEQTIFNQTAQRMRRVTPATNEPKFAPTRTVRSRRAQ